MNKLSVPERLRTTELYAWIGEDEHGSGVVGLKQYFKPALAIKMADVPSGYIPIVATTEEKVNRAPIAVAMSIQAATYGKKIYLCRFTFADIVTATEGGAPLA